MNLTARDSGVEMANCRLLTIAFELKFEVIAAKVSILVLRVLTPSGIARKH